MLLGCWKESGNVALCGMCGSLWLRFLNWTSRLCCGLNSLCLGTNTGGRTENKTQKIDKLRLKTLMGEIQVTCSSAHHGKRRAGKRSRESTSDAFTPSFLLYLFTLCFMEDSHFNLAKSEQNYTYFMQLDLYF